ncbi:MAG: acetyl-CoA hydrolase [Alphaproteobacteria bacterium]|nr:acetyl-CoA hydrolase [Alphaproteobacteria bacterium]
MRRLSPDEAVREIAARADGARRVFLPGGCAEPLALREAWQGTPEAAAGLVFCGVFLPGVNGFDYSSLHPDARLDLFFLTPALRAALAGGRATLTPAHYFRAAHMIAAREISVAVQHVSTPDGDGRCSFGLGADLGPMIVGRADYTIGLVNARMPPIADGPAVALRAFDAIVEVDAPLTEAPPAEGRADAIAAHAARFVFDDDVVQFGVGRLPTAIVAALTQKQRLRVFSGMVSDALLPLLDAGAIVDEPAAITTGMAIGGARLYERLGRERRLKMAPISHTHAYAVLSRIEKLVSINACLEVDLFGQLNAEFAGENQIASVGGLVDFIRAARAAPGGRAIVALQAETRGVSRIVPQLAHPATVSRYDAPIVVTEHGGVDLAELDLDARAEALIGLAAPAHRDSLRESWRAMRQML